MIKVWQPKNPAAIILLDFLSTHSDTGMPQSDCYLFAFGHQKSEVDSFKRAGYISVFSCPLRSTA